MRRPASASAGRARPQGSCVGDRSFRGRVREAASRAGETHRQKKGRRHSLPAALDSTACARGEPVPLAGDQRPEDQRTGTSTVTGVALFIRILKESTLPAFRSLDRIVSS